jgi:AcrR family transcriptional regulator
MSPLRAAAPAAASTDADAAPPPLFPPRQFKQKRAAATYQALLDAAALVFAARGFEATQTPDIAAAAGVSTGAFYRYFTDKRQCFVEMIARHLQRTQDEVMVQLQPERFVGKGAPATIDLAIEVLFGSLRRGVDLNRVYLHRSLSDPEVEALRTRFEARGRTVLASLIRTIVPESVVADADSAALVIQVAVLEVASEMVGLRVVSGAAGARPAGEPTEDRVKRTLREMLQRYLFPDSCAPVISPSRTSMRRSGPAAGTKAAHGSGSKDPSDASGAGRPAVRGRAGRAGALR